MKRLIGNVKMVTLAAAVAASVGVARADVDYTIGVENYGLYNVTIDDTPDNNAIVGGITLTQPDTVAQPNNPSFPQSYVTLCTDISGTLFIGNTYSFSGPTPFANQTGIDPKYWGADNKGAVNNPNEAQQAIQAAAFIFASAGPGGIASLSADAVQAAQLAVWTVLYNTTLQAGVASEVTTGQRFVINSTLSANVQSLYNSDVANAIAFINGGGTYAGSLLAPDPGSQHGATGQELLYGVVPEPSTIIAGALVLLPFGASTIRILRRKNGTA